MKILLQESISKMHKVLTFHYLFISVCVLFIIKLTYCKPLTFKKDLGDSQLTLDKLKPQDHLDALKMEHDGHINREYHKELFLGNHEDIEKDAQNADSKLKDVFFRVDGDKDEFLTEAELESWIKLKMEEHFDEALQENDEIFEHLDPDKNGKIHWKEYYVHFLLAMNIAEDIARKHVNDYDQIELDSNAKEDLIRYKFRWTDADEDPADNELTKLEFLAFRHPEQAPKTLNNMVSSIISTLDLNDDHILTEEEFTALPPGEVEEQDQRDLDQQWQAERKKEFQLGVDTNHDGKATEEELKRYLDPKNPFQAVMEARNLINLIDVDKDKKLSLTEIMNRKDIFLSSKICDFARNLHDEF
ncbi:45 kDa calcium-binding protein [Patella vulgata]|uniref:45 kDa calcium-binding protein n=1 Tax=Patella vulgata TaxID=6465 RepID=UPI00217F5EB6|nr:45 kDa calcium-binding protein [Patella vulgata]